MIFLFFIQCFPHLVRAKGCLLIPPPPCSCFPILKQERSVSVKYLLLLASLKIPRLPTLPFPQTLLPTRPPHTLIGRCEKGKDSSQKAIKEEPIQQPGVLLR